MSKELLDSLISDIQSGNMTNVDSRIAQLSDEQLDALFNEAQPFKSLGTASTNKLVLASVSNLREKYLKKLITTTMVGFLFQMKDEFKVEEKDLTNPPNKDDYMDEIAPHELPEGFNTDLIRHQALRDLFNEKFADREDSTPEEMENLLSEDDLMQVAMKTNEEYEKLTRKEKVLNSAKYNDALEAAVAAQSDTERIVIDRFLNNLFRYDANVHTQESQNKIVDDPERVDIAELKGTSPVYDNIPPNDTHCRFNAYYDINYEQMREATKNIYNVKPDLEHAMIVYDVVDAQSEVDSFIHKYGATSKYDIVTFPLNRWTLMGPFKQNRERVDFYNKHNSIIKSMLEQQEKDAALGEDLMKKRVKSTKVKAEKVFGKDSPEFNEYRKLNPSELENKYNATVEDIDENKVKVTREVTVDAETGAELTLDEDGVPLDALEVPILSINAKTGETTKTRIFTQSADN